MVLEDIFILIINSIHLLDSSKMLIEQSKELVFTSWTINWNIAGFIITIKDFPPSLRPSKLLLSLKDSEAYILLKKKFKQIVIDKIKIYSISCNILIINKKS